MTSLPSFGETEYRWPKCNVSYWMLKFRAQGFSDAQNSNLKSNFGLGAPPPSSDTKWAIHGDNCHFVIKCCVLGFLDTQNLNLKSNFRLEAPSLSKFIHLRLRSNLKVMD